MVAESGQSKWIQLKTLTPIILCRRAAIMPQSHSRNVVLPSASASLVFCLVPNVAELSSCFLCFLMKLLHPLSQNSQAQCPHYFLKAVKKKRKEVSLFYLVTFSLDCFYKKMGIQTCIVWEFNHPTDFSRTPQVPKIECKNNFSWSD